MLAVKNIVHKWCIATHLGHFSGQYIVSSNYILIPSTNWLTHLAWIQMWYHCYNQNKQCIRHFVSATSFLRAVHGVCIAGTGR